MGPSVLVCRNGTWIPDPINLMSQPVSDIRTYATLKLPTPYCSQREYPSPLTAHSPSRRQPGLAPLSRLASHSLPPGPLPPPVLSGETQSGVNRVTDWRR